MYGEVSTASSGGFTEVWDKKTPVISTRLADHFANPPATTHFSACKDITPPFFKDAFNYCPMIPFHSLYPRRFQWVRSADDDAPCSLATAIANDATQARPLGDFGKVSPADRDACMRNKSWVSTLQHHLLCLNLTHIGRPAGR